MLMQDRNNLHLADLYHEATKVTKTFKNLSCLRVFVMNQLP
jgi:hypothetical protein